MSMLDSVLLSAALELVLKHTATSPRHISTLHYLKQHQTTVHTRKACQKQVQSVCEMNFNLSEQLGGLHRLHYIYLC